MIFVANYKMNGDKNFYKKVNKIFNKLKSEDTIILCPPFIYTPFLKLKRNNIYLGVQDVCNVENKTSTGQIGAKMLNEFSVKYAIVGHSERRAIGETDEIVAQKANIAQRYNITPIICVGEKKKSDSLDILLEQVQTVLSNRESDNVIFAYEPIWAIGSGEVPTSAKINKALKIINDAANKMGVQAKVLYGGSVNIKNYKELRKTKADGFLMGGVSLKLNDFISIVKGE